MRLIFLFLFLFFWSFPLKAQWHEEPYITWEQFVQEYVGVRGGSEGTADDEEWLAQLEELALHPLQVNRVTRGELLRLPFLSEAQVDSLLAYRTARHGLLSLGELQVISDFDYFTRCYLSLFVRCDSLLPSAHSPFAGRPEQTPLQEKLGKGQHELETRLDVPLYRRAGYCRPDEPSFTNYYTGNAFHHIARYRYTYGREIAYGLTTEKDAGEPVGKRGFYPYDYLSGYLLLRPASHPWSVVLGDYEIHDGEGLLFGRTSYGGNERIFQSARRSFLQFRPHTSADEARFFRGVAAACRFGCFDAAAFVSYRRLDARFSADGDTVRSILQTGLHRTLSEIDRRRNLGCFTSGLHLGYNHSGWGLSADGYVSRYARPVFPEPRPYNQGYFRGTIAGGASLAYYYSRGRFTLQGEGALDGQTHFATAHSAAFRFSSRLSAHARYRSFASSFVSPYGQALRQGSRVANERGLLFGLRAFPVRDWELAATFDVFRFPRPTYTTVLPGARGVEFTLQSLCHFRHGSAFIFRYRVRSREHTVTGFRQMEYRTTHRLRFALQRATKRLELVGQFDGSCAHRQTGKTSWGWMLSARSAWKPVSRFRFKAFAALFFTDDYDAALYAYEPQLLRAGAFPRFAYHGVRGVLLGNLNVSRAFSLGLRVSSTTYFNRKRISSGLGEIRSSSQNDMSFQLRWLL